MSFSLSAASTTAAAMKKSAVIYHYPCPDGAFSALAAHLYFTHCPTANIPPPLLFPNTVYSPLTSNLFTHSRTQLRHHVCSGMQSWCFFYCRLEDLPLHKIGNVYLLDFVGPQGFSSRGYLLMSKDHHKTALEMLGSAAPISGNEIKVLDMERSGATIAYDYFMEKLGDIPCNKDCALAEFQQMRRIFEYNEDGDLWRWRLPHSKAFSCGLKDLNLEFDVTLNPKLFQQLLSLDLDSVIRQGMSSLEEKQRFIIEVLKQSEEIALGGGAFGHFLAVNADSVYELRSELGNQLANKIRIMNLRGIGAVVYRVPELQNDQLLKISLRSIDDEDTAPISQEYGGGGHRNASSFLLSNTEFQGWKVSVNVSIQV